MRAMSFDKSKRFPSMDDVVGPLESASHGQKAAGPRVEQAPLSTKDDPPRDRVTEAGTQHDPLPAATPDRAMALPGLPARIGGKYVPLRRIAKGGTSTVYEVEHLNTGERWALKLLDRGVALDPIALDRFKREARVSARVKSEHIVRVIDADVAPEFDDAPFLVMELLEGHTLEELTAGRKQSPARVLDWMKQVASGLERVHGLGIVHRDLKPGNLFLVRAPGDADVIKILDFGIAKMQNARDGLATACGTIVGTPQYIAPEQASGGMVTVSVASDVWALGMTTYRLLAGREYWVGEGISQLLSLVIFAPIEPPSARGLALGSPFDEWFLRSCAREPHRRFATVIDQMNALALALAAATTSTGRGLGENDTLVSVPVGPTDTPSSAVARSEPPPRTTKARRRIGAATGVSIAMVATIVAASLLRAQAGPRATNHPGAPRASTPVAIMVPPLPAAPPSAMTSAQEGPPEIPRPPAKLQQPSSAPHPEVPVAAASSRPQAPKTLPSPSASSGHPYPVNPYADPH